MEKKHIPMEMDDDALEGVSGGENVEIRIEDSPLEFVASNEEEIKQGKGTISA